jgi:hypothetical protein
MATRKPFTGTEGRRRTARFFAGSFYLFLFVKILRAYQAYNQREVVEVDQQKQVNRVRGIDLPPHRKPRHHPVRPDSVFRGFQFESNLTMSSDNKPYCESKDRFRKLPLKLNQRVVYLSGKMGHNNGFQTEIQNREIEAIEKLHWLRNASDTIFLYEVPEHWRNHEPYKQHTQFLKDPTHASSTGGGWWFWKPPLILDALKQLSPNDVLVYSDYDQTTWWPALADFIDHILKNPEIDWALPRWQGGTESKYTKRDVFEAYCGTPTSILRHTPQWEAGIHIFRPTRRVIQFVEEWQRATEDYEAISDTESLVPNEPSFAEHRRDQSLLNLMHKCWFTSDEAKYVQAPHPCGWLYGKGLIDFYFITLPSLKTSEELTLLHHRRQRFWASHNRTFEKATDQG